MLYGFVIGVGATLLLGANVWMLLTIHRMQKAMRSRMPYDAQRFAENLMAALVVAEREEEVRINAIRNAMAWGSRMMNVGKKHQREEAHDLDG